MPSHAPAATAAASLVLTDSQRAFVDRFVLEPHVAILVGPSGKSAAAQRAADVLAAAGRRVHRLPSYSYTSSSYLASSDVIVADGLGSVGEMLRLDSTLRYALDRVADGDEVSPFAGVAVIMVTNLTEDAVRERADARWLSSVRFYHVDASAAIAAAGRPAVVASAVEPVP